MIQTNEIANKHELKDLENDVFSVVAQLKESIIEFEQFYDDKFAYATSTELFTYEYSSSKSKKIISIVSPITFIRFIGELLFVGFSSGDIQVFMEKSRRCISKYSDLGSEVVSVCIKKQICETTKALEFLAISAEGEIGFYSLAEMEARKIVNVNEPIQIGTLIDDVLYLVTPTGKLICYVDDQFQVLLESSNMLTNAENIINKNNKIFLSVKKRIVVIEITSDETGRKANVVLRKIVHFNNIARMLFHEDVLYTASFDGYIKTWKFINKDTSLIQLNVYCFNDKIVSFYISKGILLVALSTGEVFSTIESTKNTSYSLEEQREKTVHISRKRVFDMPLKVSVIQKTKKLDELSKFLQQFNYKKAYEYCMRNRDIQSFYHLLKYCKENKVLKRLFKDQSKEETKLFLEFACDYFPNADLQGLIYESLVIITSINEGMLVESDFDDLIDVILEKIEEEIFFVEMVSKTIGFTE